MANPRLIIPLKGRYYITEQPEEPHYHTTINTWERLSQLSASLAAVISGSTTITAELSILTITGTIDGINDQFTLSITPSLLILFNGAVKQISGITYTLNSNIITFLAGYIPQIGDTLEAYGIE